MSWPGGPSKPKMPPPAGFKKGLARHTPTSQAKKSCGQKHQSAGWSQVVVSRGRVLMWLRGNNFLEPCAAGD
jgi:hypothetical protein